MKWLLVAGGWAVLMALTMAFLRGARRTYCPRCESLEVVFTHPAGASIRLGCCVECQHEWIIA